MPQSRRVGVAGVYFCDPAIVSSSPLAKDESGQKNPGAAFDNSARRRSDTERLDAMFTSGWTVVKQGRLYRVEGAAAITDWFGEPRDALDEAIRLDELFATSSLSLDENLKWLRVT